MLPAVQGSVGNFLIRAGTPDPYPFNPPALATLATLRRVRADSSTFNFRLSTTSSPLSVVVKFEIP
jgi:hypothetical protein